MMHIKVGGKTTYQKQRKYFQYNYRRNFPKSRKREAYGIPNRQDQKRNSSVMKALHEKHQATCKGKPIKIAARLSFETFKAKRAWNDIL